MTTTTTSDQQQGNAKTNNAVSPLQPTGSALGGICRQSWWTQYDCRFIKFRAESTTGSDWITRYQIGKCIRNFQNVITTCGSTGDFQIMVFGQQARIWLQRGHSTFANWQVLVRQHRYQRFVSCQMFLMNSINLVYTSDSKIVVEYLDWRATTDPSADFCCRPSSRTSARTWR